MFLRLLGLIAAACLAFASTANAQGKIELQWFAQAAFKLTTPDGKVVMIDPWLTGNPKCPPEWKDLDKLGKVDVIFVTHGHGDHIGDSIPLAVGQSSHIPFAVVSLLIPASCAARSSTPRRTSTPLTRHSSSVPRIFSSVRKFRRRFVARLPSG